MNSLLRLARVALFPGVDATSSLLEIDPLIALSVSVLQVFVISLFHLLNQCMRNARHVSV